MSSIGCPTLTLDVAARRGERLIVVSVLLLVLAGIAQLERPLATLSFVALCALISVAGGFFVLGWVAGTRRLARVVCQPDGRWQLCEAGGRTSERELSGASRVSAHAIWLQWSGGGGRPLLLIAGDIPAVEFRRLVVRLRSMPPTNRDER